MIAMTEKPESMLREALQELVINDHASALSRESAWKMLNALHVLHDHALRCLGEKHYTAGIEESFRELLGLGRGLYSLLEETQDTSSSVGFNRNAMLFGSASAVASSLEEFFTGEDPLQDMLVNGIPFILGRLSERSYISSAEVGFRSVLNSHALELYHRLWELVKRRERKGTQLSAYEESKNMGEGIASFWSLLSDNGLDHHLRLQLLVLLYVTLINKTLKDLDRQLERT